MSNQPASNQTRPPQLDRAQVAAIERARACGSSHEVSSVIANITAKAYARPEDLETDLRSIETRAAANKA